MPSRVSARSSTGNNVHFYNKRTGAWEMSSLPTGRARGEISLATDIHVMGDTLFVFDNNPSRLKRYYLPALLSQSPMAETFLGEIPMSDRFVLWAGVAPDRMVLVSRVENKEDGIPVYEALHGIFRHGKWDWFTLGDALGVAGLEGDALVCQLDPTLLPKLDPALRAKISNPQVLDTIDEESNFVIAKIHLK